MGPVGSALTVSCNCTAVCVINSYTWLMLEVRDGDGACVLGYLSVAIMTCFDMRFAKP